MALFAGIAVAVAVPVLAALSVDGVPTGTGASTWGSVLVWVLAVLVAAGYAFGLARLWRRVGIGRAMAVSEAMAFAAGLSMLALALAGPLDAWGRWSLAAHMGQQMLLLAFVPPLLLSGRPAAMVAQVLPRAWRAALRRMFRRTGKRLADAIVMAAAAHIAVLWFWHHPAAITAALYDLRLHALMQASFLIAGLWLWTALLQRIRDQRNGVASALIVIVSVMMQMGFLGALLTFSGRALYPACSARAAAIGLDPLSDQQLAGLLMWVPACLPYLFGGVWLLQRWLRAAHRREAEPDMQCRNG